MVGKLYLLVMFVTGLVLLYSRPRLLISAMIIKLNGQHLKAHRVVGTRPSPINFDPDNVEEDNDLITLKFINFGKSVSSIVKNSSNSIEFIPNTKNTKFINHRGMYMVQHFHFHWRQELYRWQSV